MKKIVIVFLVTFYTLFANGEHKHAMDSNPLTFVQIGNIKYDAGKLYLTFQISTFPQHELIRKEYELPQKDADRFLKLVNELELTSIRPNDSKCIDCTSFSMEYAKGRDKYQIVASRNGMNEEELAKWDAYQQRIDNTLNITHRQKEFYADLPDGRYSGTKGMLTTHYVKEAGQWFDLSEQPLYILDGVEVSPLQASKLNPEEEKYQVEVLKDAAATAIYGSRGSSGVVILTTKR